MKFILLALFLLVGCASVKTEPVKNRYSAAYTSIVDQKFMEHFASYFEPFKAGESPKVIINPDPNDVSRHKDEIISKGYVVIGHSMFKGETTEEDQGKIEAQAMSVGAKVALLKLIPLESEGYAHVVWYFAKSTIKGRLGLVSSSLDLNNREKYKRNTGAIVSVVMDRSPAFYANLIPGDIVVEINSAQVDGSEQLVEMVKKIPPNEKYVEVKVIRGEIEKIIKVDLSKDRRE